MTTMEIEAKAEAIVRWAYTWPSWPRDGHFQAAYEAVCRRLHWTHKMTDYELAVLACTVARNKARKSWKRRERPGGRLPFPSAW